MLKQNIPEDALSMSVYFNRFVQKKALIFSIPFIFFLTGQAAAQVQSKNLSYEELIVYYQEALKKNPADQNFKKKLSGAYHNRAIELMNKGKFSEAIEKEKQSYLLAPEEAIIKETLAVFYNNYGFELKSKGKLPEALENLKLALQYAPNTIQITRNISITYLDLAYSAYRNAAYTSCERFLQEAMKFDKDNPYAYILSGDVAYKKDNYEQANQDWSYALKLNPKLNDLRLQLEKLKKEMEIEANFHLREVDNFKLKFEGIEKQDLAQAVSEILRQAYRDVGQDFEFYPSSVNSVIIYPEAKLKAMEYYPDWIAGVYDGKIRIGEDIGKSKLYLQAVLYHEYTHVLIYLLAGGNVPFWLNEGLAEYEARRFKKAKIRKEQNIILRKALRHDAIFTQVELASLDLTELASLTPEKRALVYLQSESLVTYLIKRSSFYDIKQLLLRLGKKEPVQRAFREIFYMDLETLEKNWRHEFQKEE